MITQNKVQRDFYDKNMEYDMVTHRFIPKHDLLAKCGINMKTEAWTNELSDVERYNIADTIYDYWFSHIPRENKNIVLAMIAENANDEQVTIARAFGAMAHFVIRGGDEVLYKNGINFETSMYIDPQIMDKMSLGLQVKNILITGNGTTDSGLWYQGRYDFEVSDITDLVIGVDY